MRCQLALPTTSLKPSSAIRGIRTALLSALAVTAVACGGGGGGGDDGGDDTDLTPDAGTAATPDSGTTACPTGYAGATCMDCDTDYQDVDGDGVCNPSCEASGDLTLDCGANGACELDGQGQRACSCDEGYQGATCGECASGYVMGASGCELYTPSSTNLVVWLDATAGTITMVGSTAVSNWRDRRGGVGTLQALASGTARPTRVSNGLNGRTVLRFDGNDNMVIDNFPGLKTADYTVFVVMKPTGASASNVLALRHSEFGAMYQLRRTSSTGYRYNHRGTPLAGEGDFANLAFAAAEAATTKLLTMRRITSGTIDFLQINGNEPGDLDGVSGSDTMLAEPNLGNTMALNVGDGSLTGDLAEIIVYDRGVPDAEANEIRAYLAAKWGIQ